MFSFILLWQLNYPSTNQSASHICIYWAKVEAMGKAIGQHPVPSDPECPLPAGGCWPSVGTTIPSTLPSALNRGKGEQAYIPCQASHPASSQWSLTICHTLLENRSFYLPDKLWILDGPPGPPPGRAPHVCWMFPQQQGRTGPSAWSTPGSKGSPSTPASCVGFSQEASVTLSSAS